jgi:glycosyltransferase involved in cell wall biosynthesis
MKASIIIPTRNRANLLKKTIKALSDQLKSGDQLVVVDNNSRDKTAQLIKKFQEHLPVIYLKSAQKGPSAARNLGFERAKNELIVFLDDDCVVQDKWRANIEKNIRPANYGTTVFQGKIINIFTRPSLLTPLFETRNKLIWQEITTSKPWKKRLIRYLNAGNMYFHRRAVEDLEMLFDSHLFPYIGEETDLAYRLQASGKFIKFTPEVSVIHRKLPSTVWQRLQRAFMLGRLEGILLEKHLADHQLQRLFSQEIKALDRGHHQFWFSRNIIRHINLPQPIQYPIFISYLVIRDLVYYAGKTSVRFYSQNL